MDSNWISGRAELFAEAYDLRYLGPEEGELGYLLRHIGSAEGPTLELACGTGRDLIPLAERGIEMTGIDVSEDMLDRYRQKCDEKNLKVNLQIQAIQELDLAERFGSVFIASASVSVLDSESDVGSMMGRVYEHLLPGGVFLMEHNTPSDRLPTEEQRRCGMGTGITRRMDPLSPSGTSESTTPAPGVARSLGIYERYVDGRLQDTELHDGTTGLWETEMVSDHLTAAGFVDVVASAPFRDDEPPSSGWVAMRCRRPG